MKRYIVLEKEVGETPLAALTAWKAAHPEYKNVPASYAGRLDPMASGKLLILLGEECKRQKAYTDLDKGYEIEVLLDAGSDTGDALGLVEYAGKETAVDGKRVRAVLRAEQGSHTRLYPKFSSKTVGGKPLFLHALEGTLDTISIPEHEERIYAISMRSLTRISSSALRARIEAFLENVPKTDEPSKMLGADFRIDAVRESWKTCFQQAGNRECTVITLRIACGSGTYMRSLAGRIGEALQTRGLALSINRTKIGKRRLGVWYRRY